MSKIDLSILVCSTTGRSQNFYPRIMEKLHHQAAGLNNVEILCITDNKIMSIGEKRNLLKKIMRGRFGGFVDDDDMIKDNYVSSILSKVNDGSDVIVFKAMYDNGDHKREVHYDYRYPADSNTEAAYLRIPNHLMYFKKELLNMVDYQEINFGEDAFWAQAIKPYIKSQSMIDEVLYTYLDNPLTSESRTRV